MQLTNIPTYQALISVLPIGQEFVFNDISKIAIKEINKLGPFEVGDFEVTDVAQMVSHLVGSSFLSNRVEEIFLQSGRLDKRTVFYKVNN